MVAVICERGYAQTTVTEVCGRARISRATFYQEFANLRECFLAVIDAGYGRAEALIVEAFEQESEWRDGLRAALASVLTEMDAGPALAQACLIEALAAGGWALERREWRSAALTEAIVARWPVPPGAHSVRLAAPGVMESMLGLIRAHLLGGSEQPAITLLGQLMGLIVNVYQDARAATAEIGRCEVVIRRTLASYQAREQNVEGPSEEPVPIPVALRDPRAHRLRGCLLYLLDNPGASNREVGQAVGVARDDQISATLTRLGRSGLLVKHRERPGSANAWMLSPEGEKVARTLLRSSGSGVASKASRRPPGAAAA